MNSQSLPPPMQNASQIRHTSEVNSGEPIFLDIRSDLERAGLMLTRLLRIDNSDLMEKFQIESEQLKKSKQYDKGEQFASFNLKNQIVVHLNIDISSLALTLFRAICELRSTAM